MNAAEEILTRLLDKYEKSMHLTKPGVSKRRVMLSVQKKELPGYQYEIADVRDAYHAAARSLEEKELVTLEWLDQELLLSVIILNLKHVMDSYREIGRIHPQERAAKVEALISNQLSSVATPWIKSWRDKTCQDARERMKLPSFCKEQDTLLHDLLTAFVQYDQLQSSITMRAFSSICYHDTKQFERTVREQFLHVAQQHDPSLAFAMTEGDMGVRDQLAFLGIYARPELYELCGKADILTKYGTICVGAAPASGLGIPSTLIDEITGFTLDPINTVTFIENKTNYDEYLVSEKQQDELVIYHGGFLSPQKKKLLGLLSKELPDRIQVCFWADIDLGGFKMFEQLQSLFPHLRPMRMSATFVEQFHANGLARSDDYLRTLEDEFNRGLHPLFSDAITTILKYRVTIEQEIFLEKSCQILKI